MKKWIKRCTGIACIVVGLYSGGMALAANQDVYSVEAPTADLRMEFWLDEGIPHYKVVSGGKELIEDAEMGLSTSLGDLNSGLTLVGEPAESSEDSTWQPVVGEQDVIRDHYNQKVFTLQDSSGTEMGIAVRAYDEGVAFRYVLPEVPEGTDSYTVSDENTQFVFPAGTKANLHIGGNQTIPKEYAVEKLPGGVYQRPTTMEYTDGQFLTICEGNLDNYAVMLLNKDTSQERTIKADYISENKIMAVNGIKFTPWRVFVIGNGETKLAEHSPIVMNLNEAPDEETYGYSEWVDPGTCLRAASGMNNNAIKSIIDQAQGKHIKYVLLDTGWYGPEYDTNCDPRLDPSKLDPSVESDKILLDQYFATEGGYNNTGEGVFNTRGVGFDVYKKLGTAGNFQTNVDIPALCEYANAKNVGIILYVNGVFFPDSSGRNRFTTDELFSYFEKWGVKGVKPGFVKCRSQEAEAYMEKVIQCAAKHRLVLTIHDEYVTTGIERTYPNLMETEGILGDEGIRGDAIREDIATLFTRPIQGPTDHTFCYPGKGTKAYALASPLMFRSGMSVLYWYTNPSSVPSQDKEKMGIWDSLPTSWDRTLYLEGSMYEYATFARKNQEDWYLGSLSAISRVLEVPLTFLDADTWYVADIYADGVDADAGAGFNTSAKNAQTLENRKYLVNSRMKLERDLDYGFGYAAKFTKASEEDTQTYEIYNRSREELELSVKSAEMVSNESYTEESWQTFASALAQAKAVLEDTSATDEELNQKKAALVEAQEHLVSTERVMKALADAGRYTSWHFTEDSWAVLAQAVQEAEQLLAGTFIQEEMDQAAQGIEKAIEGLVKNPDATLKKTVYLSELDYDAARSTCGPNNTRPGNIRKNANRAGTALTLMIDGAAQTFDKGMGADAPSDLYYDIAGKGFEIFEAYVGVDAAKQNMGSIIFRVYGDGDLLYESKASGTGANDAQFFSIPVGGVSELRLEADMNGSDQGDWADWADAKFLNYRNPYAYLDGIKVNRAVLKEFSQDRTDYVYPVRMNQEVPVVEAVPVDDQVVYQVQSAKTVPGYTQIHVTLSDGSVRTYKIWFCTLDDSDYLSDLPDSLILYNTLHYGKVFKDRSVKGDAIALTAEDGSSEMKFEKGIGAHASSSTDSTVIYNIEGRGYDRFEGYVGIRYATNDEEVNGASPTGVPRSSINFKIYVDDETEPRFESGVMTSRTPAAYYNVDVQGAKQLRLVVDSCGDQSADHGNFGGARFLKYTTYRLSGVVDTGDTGMDPEGIRVKKDPVTAEDTEIADTLTDPEGRYQFEGLMAAEYTVKVEKGEDNKEASQTYEIVGTSVSEANLLLEVRTLPASEIKEILEAAQAAQAAAETAKAAAGEAQAKAEQAKMDAQTAGAQAVEAQTKAEAAQAAAEAAAAQADADQAVVAQAKAEAETAAAAAETAKQNAATAAAQADTAQTAAEAAQKKAEDAQAAAETARDAALTAKDDTEAAKVLAEKARDDAEKAKTEAVSAGNAATAAQAAAQAAKESAEAQAVLAQAAKDAAETAASVAQAAQKAAEDARDEAAALLKEAQEEADAKLAEAEKARDDAVQLMKKAQEEADAKQAAAEALLKKAEELNESTKLLLEKGSFQSQRVTITKAKSTKKKTAKISWEKVEGAEGYVVEYSLKAGFKGAKKVIIKKGTVSAKTIKKLKSRKSYYVRVSAYKTINGETVYSEAGTKRVRIK